MRTIFTVLVAEGFTAKHIKNKLGVRGSATGDLHFDNVKVKYHLCLNRPQSHFEIFN